MNGSAMLREIEVRASESLATVIPIRFVKNKNDDDKEKLLKVHVKLDKKLPLFYEEPIFKSKKHDFL
jgi:hypothetical protein